MLSNRTSIGKTLLITLVALLTFSFVNPPEEMSLENRYTQVTKFQENVDVPETNLLRSGTEVLTAVFKISSDFNFTSSETFFSNSVQVHLARIEDLEGRIQSYFKIYLQFLRLLI